MGDIRIEIIAKQFGVTGREAYSVILAHSNSTLQQVMRYETPDRLVISEDFYTLMVESDGYLKGLVYPEFKVEKNAHKHIPFDTLPRVYFLLDDTVIVYVGQSIKLAGRITTHIGDKEFNRVATFSVSEDELNIAEAANIMHYNPIYNKTYVAPIDYLKTVLERCIP